jgi:lipopolysaccharide export LptBFGC system permease protein LptF
MGLSDAEFACDGKLAVFNRDLECDRVALSQKRYEDVRSLYQRGKRALPYELSLNADEKKAYALQQFKDHPIRALTTSLPLSWRGFWGFRASDWKGVVLNLMAFVALFLAPVLSVAERRISWLMVSVVPISLFAFYGLVSHFLPRYSLPIVPSSIVCLSMLIVSIFGSLYALYRPGSRPPVRLN